MLDLEDVILLSLNIWFAFFIVNHAEMFSKIRTAAMPALPRWLSYPLTCSVCFAFWILATLSLFIGWTPKIFWCPPCVLFFELGFQRLKPNSPTAPEIPAQPPILPTS